MATPIAQSGLPVAASERGWARVLPVSRDTIREARRRGELVASRLGTRQVVILRDGEGGVLEWLARHRVGRPAERIDARVEEAIRREEARERA